MADGFSVSPQDGQQLQGVFHDPAFYSADANTQKQRLAGLAVFKKLPASMRGQVVDSVLSQKDAIRKKLGVSLPQPKAAGPSLFQRAEPMLSHLGQEFKKNALPLAIGPLAYGVEPISEIVTGNPHANLRELNQREQRKYWKGREAAEKNPQTFNDKAHVAIDTAFDEVAGLTDFMQSPVGIVTAGIGPLLRGIEMAGEPLVARALVKTAQWGEKAARLGFAGSQIKDVWDAWGEVRKNPTTENITRAITKLGIAGILSKPEVENTIRNIRATPEKIRASVHKAQRLATATKAGAAGFKSGVREARSPGSTTITSVATPEPPKIAPQFITEQARKYKVTPDEYEEAHNLPVDELARRTHETQRQIQTLESARRYNEAARTAIPLAEARLAKLQQGRDEAELALKDTKSFDKEIAGIEGKLASVREKVANNGKTIGDLNLQNLEAKHRLYTETLRNKEAVPVQRGVKRYPAQQGAKPQPERQEPNPLRKQVETKALPAGKPIPQARPIHREYVADEETQTFRPARQPLQIEGARVAKGPFPMGGTVKGQPEQIEGTPERRQIAAPQRRKALPPVAERTPEGAIRAKAATPVRPPVKPIKGQIAAPEKPQEAPKQLTAPKHRYQPYTIERGADGKPLIAFQPREQGPAQEGTQAPPKPKVARSEQPRPAKAEAPPKAEPPAPEKAETPVAPKEEPPKKESTPAPPRIGEPKTEAPPANGKNGAPPRWLQSADDETKEAYARIRERLKRGERGSLTLGGREQEDDLGPLLPDLQKVGKHLFDYGIKNFKDWSRAMVSDIGDFIKPHLDRIWKAMGDFPKAGTLQQGEVTELPKEEIHSDPNRFQFKSKAIGRAGVTDKFQDVTEFRPELAGTGLVWKDPANGKTYAVNMHHRLELANRTNYPHPLAVRYSKARTAEEARVEGALTNIGEGNGDPIDVAKVLRDTGLTPQEIVSKHGVAPRSLLLKQGAALAKLSDPIFNKVATGELPEGRGAIIGELLSDPADQEAAAKLAQRAAETRPKMTDAEFREAVRLQVAQAKHATVKRDGGLFGDYEEDQNLALEIGEVSQYVRGKLSSDKRLLSTVAKESVADKLNETGNVIRTDENAQRAKELAQFLELYDKMSGTSGPIAETLEQAAKDIVDGQNASQVKQRAADQIRVQLGEDLSKVVGGAKGPARSESSGVSGAGRVPPAEGRGLPGQRGLGTDEETEQFNAKREADLAKERRKAQLNSPIQQGDKSRPIEAESPLFRNKPIDTRPPQGSMFGETEPPPKKKDSTGVESPTTQNPPSNEGEKPQVARSRRSLSEHLRDAATPDEKAAAERLKKYFKSERGSFTIGNREPSEEEQRVFEDLKTIGKLLHREGMKAFGDWSREMLNAFGEYSKPYLRPVWSAISGTTKESRNATAPPPRPGTREGSRSDAEGSRGPSGELGHERTGGPGGSGARSDSPAPEANTAEAPFEQHYITVGSPPHVDTSKVPEPTGGYQLRDDQRQTTALAIRELEQGGGFLSASGAGVGKTASAVAVAKHFTGEDKKVLIVAPNNVWSFDKQGKPGGSYGEWFQQYGVDPVSYKSGTPVENGKTYISTYERFRDFPVDKDTYVVYDEAHALKIADSGRAGSGLKQIDKAAGVYYMTATPADKPFHIQYLSRMGILEGRTPAQAVSDLGMEIVQRQRKDGSVSQSWQIKKGFTPKMIRQRFADLFDKMIREGKMRKDELSLDNMDIGVERVTLPSEAHEVTAKIERELGAESAMGLKKAVILGHVRRQQEPFKIDYVVDKAQDDIANGRKVVVFLSRVNRSDVIRHDKIWVGGERQTVDTLIHTSEGTAKTLKQRFRDLGLKVSEIHGASETGNPEAMRQFQSGDSDVVIATAPSGGVGINLDDTRGDAPRSVYVMTPEFDAMNNVQLIGRAYRASTKSRAKVSYLFADTGIDNWNMGILSDKIKLLQSVVQGESGKLNMLDYIREEPEEEERPAVRTQTPPRTRKRRYQPEPNDEVYFLHKGQWRRGTVLSTDHGRIMVRPLARALGPGPIDIAGGRYSKAR